MKKKKTVVDVRREEGIFSECWIITWTGDLEWTELIAGIR